MVKTALNVKGCQVFKGYLTPFTQKKILEDIREIIAFAPLFSPLTPWGKPMSVKMTSAGKYGWYSDKSGYRYVLKHPNGSDWPAIPRRILNIWQDLCANHPDPDCCLINFYQEAAKMGLHQDKDEKDFHHPVLSISLGDDGLFRIGGTSRKDKTQSFWLSSGDVVILGGESRLAFHGIDRIKPASSNLLKSNGRLNLTLRVVS